MTKLDPLALPPLAEPSVPASSWGRNVLDRIEALLERWGDRLNPILVKEARQALKSKQFTISFALLLICGWAWSILGVISQMPDIYYAPSGMMLLSGYYFVLAVPLLLIVPFSSFRSLAAEREDGTYELLSISTLSSRQIVTGKLGSSLLQMMVYYSALAPCIAFTYMLRGVDLISIALLLLYTFCVSVLLCCVGLVFAGLARSRQWQSLISVVLLLGLAFVGFWWAIGVAEMLDGSLDNLPVDDLEFWTAQLAVLTAFVSYVALLIAVAAAQNSFASDNRSTPIRVVIAIQNLLYIGWVAYAWFQFGAVEMLLVAFIFAGIHWCVYGILMTGESAVLSPRVRRQLPMSFLGRVYLTWFNPGSGTGFVFAVSHMLLLAGLVTTAVITQEMFGYPVPQYRLAGFDTRVSTCALLSAGYYICYLGLSRLLIVLIPRRERYGFVLPTLIHVLVLLAGSALPFVLESWVHRFGPFNYSATQITNWLWTLEECIDTGVTDPFVPIGVGLATGVILLINMMVVRSEIEAVRVEAPERVKLEDQQLRGDKPPVVRDPLAEV